MVRGATVLPNGTGKTVRVAVFADGENAKAAEAAGADIVGMDDLAAKVKAGELNFDVVIAAPDAMRVVGALGQILGPRGLMPNPKVGTVTPDVAGAVKNAKSGQVRYRVDKGGIIHCSIGTVKFEVNALKENIQGLLVDLNKAKPAAAKGILHTENCRVLDHGSGYHGRSGESGLSPEQASHGLSGHADEKIRFFICSIFANKALAKMTVYPYTVGAGF